MVKYANTEKKRKEKDDRIRVEEGGGNELQCYLSVGSYLRSVPYASIVFFFTKVVEKKEK